MCKSRFHFWTAAPHPRSENHTSEQGRRAHIGREVLSKSWKKPGFMQQQNRNPRPRCPKHCRSRRAPADFSLLHNSLNESYLSCLCVCLSRFLARLDLSPLILTVAPCLPGKRGARNCREQCGPGGFAPPPILNQRVFGRSKLDTNHCARLLAQRPYVNVSPGAASPNQGLNIGWGGTALTL